MNIGMDSGISGGMSESVECGAGLAWRLLATLEGGSLLLAVSALLAYTARSRIASRSHRVLQPAVNTVLITNTANELGRKLKKQLEAHGCVVSTVTDGAISGAGSGCADKVDALVVVGAQPKFDGLDGLSGLVTEDVYSNMKLLESLSSRVKPGGCIAWACAGAGAGVGAFSDAAAAFDNVLQSSLVHIAKVFRCVPIWVGRCDGTQRTAERVVAALMTCDNESGTFRSSIRYAVHAVGEYIYRSLKSIT